MSLKQESTEYFGRLEGEMREQICRLRLPLAQEQLKSRLNEIQNGFYNKLSVEFCEIQNFKRHHRLFLQITNSINKEMRSHNGELLRAQVLKEVQQFINQHFRPQNIQPTNLITIKVLAQRIQFKIKGEAEGYQLLLNALLQVLQVSQSKALAMQRQLAEQRKFMDCSTLQKKNVDLCSLSTKKQLHQALTTISNLKATQEQLQKQLVLANKQLQSYQNEIYELRASQQERVSFLNSCIEQNKVKLRAKNEEHNKMLKGLREESNRLMNEVEVLKSEKMMQNLSDLKQFVFEQKIRELIQKKEGQKRQMLVEIDDSLKKSGQILKLHQEEQRLRHAEAQAFRKHIQTLTLQQQDYLQHIKSIQALQTQNKKTYNQTLNAIKDNDRAFKNIQNISSSNSKMLACCKKSNPAEEKQMAKRYEEMMQKVKREGEFRQEQLNRKVCKLAEQNECLHRKCKQLQAQTHQCKREMYSLQSELVEARQRFAETMSEIQIIKQKERSFYEESMVRLLSNLDRRQSTNDSTKKR